jgi:hypothetical protein
MSDIARKLERLLNTPAKPQAVPTDALSQMFLAKLEEKDIVSGVLPPPPEPTNSDRLREYVEWTKTYEAERDAKQKAEEEAEQLSQTSTAELLIRAFKGEHSDRSELPLNGAAILRAAIKGVGAGGNSSDVR